MRCVKGQAVDRHILFENSQGWIQIWFYSLWFENHLRVDNEFDSGVGKKNLTLYKTNFLMHTCSNIVEILRKKCVKTSKRRDKEKKRWTRCHASVEAVDEHFLFDNGLGCDIYLSSQWFENHLNSVD